MGLTYPKIKHAEDVVFREQFLNPQFLADNGGTTTGSPAISRGVVLNGTSQYVTYNGDFFNNEANITIEIFFVPGFAYDEDVVRYLCDSTAGSGFSIIKQNNARSNTLDIELGGTTIAQIATGTYSALWQQGVPNHIVISGTTGATDVYLNNNLILDADATAWSAVSPTNFYLGADNAGANWFSGIIVEASVYDRKYTAAEVNDRFTFLQTFLEITPEKSELWLPLRTHFASGGNEVTTNLGSMSDDEVYWGNGTIGATNPTLLDNNGVSFVSGDYIKVNTPVALTALDAKISCGVLIRLGVVNDYQSICENGNNWYLFTNNVGRVTFSLLDGAGSYHKYVVGTTYLQKDVWYHVAGCYDGTDVVSGISVYINGVKETASNSNWDAGLTDNSRSLAWGVKASNYVTYPITGAMKFPFVIRDCLTETQAKWLSDYSFKNINL